MRELCTRVCIGAGICMDTTLSLPHSRPPSHSAERLSASLLSSPWEQEGRQLWIMLKTTPNGLWAAAKSLTEQGDEVSGNGTEDLRARSSMTPRLRPDLWNTLCSCHPSPCSASQKEHLKTLIFDPCTHCVMLASILTSLGFSLYLHSWQGLCDSCSHA